MPQEFFHTARVKVKRARKHISDIGPVFAAVSLHQDDFLKAASILGLPIGTSHFVTELSLSEGALDEIACCVGDAVHNLRASLDLLACEVVERSPNGNPNNVHFPFSETAIGLTQKTNRSPAGGMIRGKNFHRARQDAQCVLLALEPHGEPHGNDLLYGLHRLDLIDKHQDLLALSHDVRAPALYFEGVKLPAQNTLPARLVFATGGPFAGREIMSVLDSLASEAERAIEEFANLDW